ncbi:MAG: acyltransferase family protein [Beijerinckiaceae bacterium]
MNAEPAEKRDAGDRYYLIDLLRAFAAFAVLFWHFQIFAHFDPVTQSVLPDRAALPLHSLASAFYYHGHWAVQLFWVISGFVFFATYTPRGQTTTAYSFFVHRLARLYPLHFVTLLIVALLQLVSIYKLGTFQVYPFNDLRHFVLQLFMASHWGLQKGFSFNGPIWSVSVEILIYGAFFLVLRFAARDHRAYAMTTLVLLVIGFFTRRHTIGQCLFYFFCGGATWLLHQRIRREWTHLARPILAGFIAAAMAAHVWLQTFQPNAASHLSFALMFTALVLALAQLEQSIAAPWFRKAQPLGDLTYGLYLWHMPLLIGTIIVMDIYKISRDAADSLWFLLAFLAAVIALSRLGFVYLEKPANATIKRRLLRG